MRNHLILCKISVKNNLKAQSNKMKWSKDLFKTYNFYIWMNNK